jgi:hypothetical protein
MQSDPTDVHVALALTESHQTQNSLTHKALAQHAGFRFRDIPVARGTHPCHWHGAACALHEVFLAEPVPHARVVEAFIAAVGDSPTLLPVFLALQLTQQVFEAYDAPQPAPSVRSDAANVDAPAPADECIAVSARDGWPSRRISLSSCGGSMESDNASASCR